MLSQSKLLHRHFM